MPSTQHADHDVASQLITISRTNMAGDVCVHVYTLLGDPTMYTPVALAQRARLRKHPHVMHAIDAFWEMMVPENDGTYVLTCDVRVECVSLGCRTCAPCFTRMCCLMCHLLLHPPLPCSSLRPHTPSRPLPRLLPPTPHRHVTRIAYTVSYA